MRHLRIYAMIEAVHRAGSIRKAAEDVNMTPSALNRRIQSFEEEFGEEIFERLPRGMRLNPAGELLLHHIRAQRTDFARLQSQVADLSGVRRGHVSVACSQALLPYFLPREIAAYRGAHPGVTFTVKVRDRVQAERDLVNFDSDLALVFEPAHMVDFEVLAAARQRVWAVMARDHPLAGRPEVRLRDCLEHDIALPVQSLGVRAMMERAAKRIGRALRPAIETDSFDLLRHVAAYGRTIGFQIPIGLDPARRPDLSMAPLSEKDVPAGELLLGQMRGRALPVASIKFARQVAAALEDASD